MPSVLDYFPKLAREGSDKKRILKEYNRVLISKYQKIGISKFYLLGLLGKVGNLSSRDEVFKRLVNQDDLTIRFSINDFCFKHYNICTLIRSSLLGKVISDDQKLWFQKNISENIWKLENPFFISFFILNEKSFSKELLKGLYELYSFDLPSAYESLSLFNLKRSFFLKKLSSPHRSLLDVFYLFRLGDKNLSYFRGLK